MILQKIKTGSQLFLDNNRDKDYFVFYSSENNIDLEREENEEFFLVNLKMQENPYFKRRLFFIIMTYIFHKENDIEYEVLTKDYFKQTYYNNIDILGELFYITYNSQYKPEESKIGWWFEAARNYLETGRTGITTEKVEKYIK